MKTSIQSNAKLSGYISLDRILELIQDIQWHNLDEMVKVIPMPSDKLNVILHFLQEQLLIERKNEMLRITCSGLKFLQLKS
jgi:RIO-like serine/threonine protein kinase